MLRKIALIATLSFISACTTVHRTDDESPISSPQQQSTVTPGVAAPNGPVTARPKIGVILGPGGLKSFAHIGVLREFENARIPVARVAGIEWGSLVAGLYSVKGKSNDAEWKLFKLQKDVLPKKEFIGRSFEPASMADMTPFLDNSFEGHSINDGAIPFMCPSRAINKYGSMIFQKNSYADAVELCLPFPPLFKPNNGWVASAFSVKALAESMRKAGAEFIVLVNVTPGFQRINENASAAEGILWASVMDEMNGAKAYVNYVVDVNIQDKSIMDFDSRREFILIGQQYGKIAAQRLARMLGF